MAVLNALVYLSCLSLVISLVMCETDSPSHMKPFGWGDQVPLEEVDGFIPVKQFFEEYVIPNRPVVMRGANKIWPGYEHWQSDEYFRKSAPEEPYIVSMDIKRGTPDKPSDYVDFKEFLQMYNTSSRRMVEFTPSFLKNDVFVPTSLDCEEITQGEVLMGNKMWFGAQYTTSAVHKDAADNINCLVYGVKNYTVVAPEYDPYIYLDRPDGLFSTMDVDKVDAEKYPGLDNVRFQLAEIHGGDCVFIPYKWIHQVRSYGRNIAVNIWWNHWKNNELDLSKCEKVEKEKPITEAKFHGWGDFETRDEGIREHARDLIAMANVIKPVSFPRWVGIYTNGLKLADTDPLGVLRLVNHDVKKAMRSAFDTIDANNDKKITPQEFDNMTQEQQDSVTKDIKYVLKATREQSHDAQDADKGWKKEQVQREKAGGHGKTVATEETERQPHDEF